MIFIDPMPSEAELLSFYESYYTDPVPHTGAERGTRWPRLRRLFHLLSGDADPRDFIELRPGLRLLDYGCGGGTYLRTFQAHGQISASGVDISAKAVAACIESGLDVRLMKDLKHVPFADGEFDVVFGMQVLEHVREPHEVVRELARVLKPGGVLYLALPNVQSVWRERFGEAWVAGWFAPFHLVHYNREGIRRVAEPCGLWVADSWSTTPESWFRLNLRARLGLAATVERSRMWFDGYAGRVLMMLLLRFLELGGGERDCLVVKLEKRIPRGLEARTEVA